MTIIQQEELGRENQELNGSSDTGMFQSLQGASKKPSSNSQWQPPPFTSLYQLLTEPPPPAAAGGGGVSDPSSHVQEMRIMLQPGTTHSLTCTEEEDVDHHHQIQNIHRHSSRPSSSSSSSRSPPPPPHSGYNEHHHNYSLNGGAATHHSQRNNGLRRRDCLEQPVTMPPPSSSVPVVYGSHHHNYTNYALHPPPPPSSHSSSSSSGSGIAETAGNSSEAAAAANDNTSHDHRPHNYILSLQQQGQVQRRGLVLYDANKAASHFWNIHPHAQQGSFKEQRESSYPTTTTQLQASNQGQQQKTNIFFSHGGAAAAAAARASSTTVCPSTTSNRDHANTIRRRSTTVQEAPAGKMFTYIEEEDSTEFHQQQQLLLSSDLPGAADYHMYRKEPSKPQLNLMERFAAAAQLHSTCFDGSTTSSSNCKSPATGEHEGDPPQLQGHKTWSISADNNVNGRNITPNNLLLHWPQVSTTSTVAGTSSIHHGQQQQQQDSDNVNWILSNMPSSSCHSRTGAAANVRALDLEQRQQTVHENSGLDLGTNQRRGAQDLYSSGLQSNNNLEQLNINDPAHQMIRHTMSKQLDSRLLPFNYYTSAGHGEPTPNYKGLFQASETLLSEGTTDAAALQLQQRLSAYNCNGYPDDPSCCRTPQALCSGDAEESGSTGQQSNVSVASHQIRNNLDVNQSLDSSQQLPDYIDAATPQTSCYDRPTTAAAAAALGQHVVVDDDHCSSESRKASANATDACKSGGMIVSSSCRRLSTLRMEMRKGSYIQDRNEEPQPKQKRKKVRCKVLRDKSKPRGRKGQKTAHSKETVNSSTNLQGDENQGVDYNINTEAEESKQNAQGRLVDEDVIGLLDNHGDCMMICMNESTSAGNVNGTAAIHLKESSTCVGSQLRPGSSYAGICQLVDYLGLSDVKCHSGEDDLISVNFVSCNETHNPPSEERSHTHELVPYDQNVAALRHHPHDKNALPLYLFSGHGETSSTGSTELVVVSNESSLQPANAPSEDNMQLILYNQRRDIVVSRPTRMYKKIRAKVQLDPESQRVWLQLENGGSPPVDTDPDKAKYWEKERQDMKKRVDFFIRKMHFVQGDRRFSRWKGSIVDSVVGAFLTQNVSDHLSSSAFMAVASRFPAVPKTENADITFAHNCQKDRNRESRPLQIETSFPGLTNEPYTLLESNGSIVIDESTVNYIENSEITDYCKQTENDKCDSQAQIKTGYVGHYGNDVNTTVPHSYGKLKRQSALLSSDDERNSICTFDLGHGENRIEDVSEAFRKTSPSRNNKVRRMLHFDNTDKQESLSCSVLETNKHVGFSIFHEAEVASDNISDQQSESESVIGSSSSVQSLQDSNYNLQLTTTQDLNFHAEMVRANSQELDIPKVDQNSKKRSLSVSSISGIERAQIEANQKGRKKNHHRDWESVRREVLGIPASAKNEAAGQRPRPPDHEDSVNWDAVRLAELGELAETIKERGMHHVLSGRIKAFLTSLYEEHGSIDLEWLRNLSTETAREYLMSVHGLGVKSVECIRLLTLHHLAFPVDTNVGRICVRLGWVPIEPLPEEVQLHLVELYPIQETIQKYLWPRLCTLDQRTLYELHYQLITFGKVFCTKSKPNCNACPLRTECKHFASAYASAKPLLTGPKEDKNDRIGSGAADEELPALSMDARTSLLDYPQEKSMQFTWSYEAPLVSEIETSMRTPFEHHHPSVTSYSEDFYVEMPASPEQTYDEDLVDIEDMGANMYIYKNYNDYSLDLIGENISVDESDQSLIVIHDELTSKEIRSFSHPATLPRTATFNSPPILPRFNNISPHRCSNDEIASTSQIHSCDSKCNTSSDVTCTPAHETDIVEISENAIVALPEAAQIPVPKLKNVGRLRTIHYVYELPDDHCLLKSVDPREKDDPCCYLLAIWSPGETPGSQQDIDQYCRDEFSTQSSSSSSGADETVAGTLLIPCRTAMHGNFPLNGTYFQVNEVFADHESSMSPIQVPRSLLWCLRRRFVYFGTSVPNIFKGLSTDEIKDCFWRGFVCVRGFDRQSRAPKPLVCRLHFPISKQPQKPNKQQRRKSDEK